MPITNNNNINNTSGASNNTTINKNLLSPNVDSAHACGNKQQRRKSTLSGNGFFIDYSCTRRRSSAAFNQQLAKEQQEASASNHFLRTYLSPVRYPRVAATAAGGQDGGVRGRSFCAGSHYSQQQAASPSSSQLSPPNRAHSRQSRATSCYSAMIGNLPHPAQGAGNNLALPALLHSPFALAGSRKTSIFDQTGHSIGASPQQLYARRRSTMISSANNNSSLAGGHLQQPTAIESHNVLPNSAMINVARRAAKNPLSRTSKGELAHHVPVIGCSPTSIRASLDALEETRRYEKLLRRLKRHQRRREKRKRQEFEEQWGELNLSDNNEQEDEEEDGDEEDDLERTNQHYNRNEFQNQNIGSSFNNLRRKSLRAIRDAASLFTNTTTKTQARRSSSARSRQNNHHSINKSRNYDYNVEALSISSLSFMSSKGASMPSLDRFELNNDELFLDDDTLIDLSNYHPQQEGQNNAFNVEGDEDDHEQDSNSLITNNLLQKGGAANNQAAAAPTAAKQPQSPSLVRNAIRRLASSIGGGSSSNINTLGQQGFRSGSIGQRADRNKSISLSGGMNYWYSYYYYLRENSMERIDDLPPLSATGQSIVSDTERRAQLHMNYSLARIEILNSLTNPIEKLAKRIESAEAAYAEEQLMRRIEKGSSSCCINNNNNNNTNNNNDTPINPPPSSPINVSSISDMFDQSTDVSLLLSTSSDKSQEGVECKDRPPSAAAATDSNDNKINYIGSLEDIGMLENETCADFKGNKVGSSCLSSRKSSFENSLNQSPSSSTTSSSCAPHNDNDNDDNSSPLSQQRGNLQSIKANSLNCVAINSRYINDKGTFVIGKNEQQQQYLNNNRKNRKLPRGDSSETTTTTTNSPPSISIPSTRLALASTSAASICRARPTAGSKQGEHFSCLPPPSSESSGSSSSSSSASSRASFSSRSPSSCPPLKGPAHLRLSEQSLARSSIRGARSKGSRGGAKRGARKATGEQEAEAECEFASNEIDTNHLSRTRRKVASRAAASVSSGGAKAAAGQRLDQSRKHSNSSEWLRRRPQKEQQQHGLESHLGNSNDTRASQNKMTTMMISPTTANEEELDDFERFNQSHRGYKLQQDPATMLNGKQQTLNLLVGPERGEGEQQQQACPASGRPGELEEVARGSRSGLEEQSNSDSKSREPKTIRGRLSNLRLSIRSVKGPFASSAKTDGLGKSKSKSKSKSISNSNGNSNGNSNSNSGGRSSSSSKNNNNNKTNTKTDCHSIFARVSKNKQEAHERISPMSGSSGTAGNGSNCKLNGEKQARCSQSWDTLLIREPMEKVTEQGDKSLMAASTTTTTNNNDNNSNNNIVCDGEGGGTRELLANEQPQRRLLASHGQNNNDCLPLGSRIGSDGSSGDGTKTYRLRSHSYSNRRQADNNNNNNNINPEQIYSSSLLTRKNLSKMSSPGELLPHQSGQEHEHEQERELVYSRPSWIMSDTSGTQTSGHYFGPSRSGTQAELLHDAKNSRPTGSQHQIIDNNNNNNNNNKGDNRLSATSFGVSNTNNIGSSVTSGSSGSGDAGVSSSVSGSSTSSCGESTRTTTTTKSSSDDCCDNSSGRIIFDNNKNNNVTNDNLSGSNTLGINLINSDNSLYNQQQATSIDCMGQPAQSSLNFVTLSYHPNTSSLMNINNQDSQYLPMQIPTLDFNSNSRNSNNNYSNESPIRTATTTTTTGIANQFFGSYALPGPQETGAEECGRSVRAESYDVLLFEQDLPTSATYYQATRQQQEQEQQQYHQLDSLGDRNNNNNKLTTNACREGCCDFESRAEQEQQHQHQHLLSYNTANNLIVNNQTAVRARSHQSIVNYANNYNRTTTTTDQFYFPQSQQYGPIESSTVMMAPLANNTSSNSSLISTSAPNESRFIEQQDYTLVSSENNNNNINNNHFFRRDRRMSSSLKIPKYTQQQHQLQQQQSFTEGKRYLPTTMAKRSIRTPNSLLQPCPVCGPETPEGALGTKVEVTNTTVAAASNNLQAGNLNKTMLSERASVHDSLDGAHSVSSPMGLVKSNVSAPNGGSFVQQANNNSMVDIIRTRANSTGEKEILNGRTEFLLQNKGIVICSDKSGSGIKSNSISDNLVVVVDNNNSDNNNNNNAGQQKVSKKQQQLKAELFNLSGQIDGADKRKQQEQIINQQRERNINLLNKKTFNTMVLGSRRAGKRTIVKCFIKLLNEFKLAADEYKKEKMLTKLMDCSEQLQDIARQQEQLEAIRLAAQQTTNLSSTSPTNQQQQQHQQHRSRGNSWFGGLLNLPLPVNVGGVSRKRRLHSFIELSSNSREKQTNKNPTSPTNSLAVKFNQQMRRHTAIEESSFMNETTTTTAAAAAVATKTKASIDKNQFSNSACRLNNFNSLKENDEFDRNRLRKNNSFLAVETNPLIACSQNYNKSDFNISYNNNENNNKREQINTNNETDFVALDGNANNVDDDDDDDDDAQNEVTLDENKKAEDTNSVMSHKLQVPEIDWPSIGNNQRRSLGNYHNDTDTDYNCFNRVEQKNLFTRRSTNQLITNENGTHLMLDDSTRAHNKASRNSIQVNKLRPLFSLKEINRRRIRIKFKTRRQLNEKYLNVANHQTSEGTTIVNLQTTQKDKPKLAPSEAPDLFLIVYAINDRKLICKLRTSNKEQQKEIPLPIILVANKIDLERAKLVKSEEGRNLAKRNNCKFMEISCTVGFNLDNLLVGIRTQLVLRHHRVLNSILKNGRNFDSSILPNQNQNSYLNSNSNSNQNQEICKSNDKASKSGNTKNKNDNILKRFYKRYVMDEQNNDCDNFSKL